MSAPTVTNVRRRNGVAGQYEMSAMVAYPGEGFERIAFISSVYGPPIVMVAPNGHQVFVSSRVTDRIGSTLDERWVRAFFAPHEPSGRTDYWQAEIGSGH